MTTRISIPVTATTDDTAVVQKQIEETAKALSDAGVVITPQLIYKLLEKVRNNPLIVRLL